VVGGLAPGDDGRAAASFRSLRLAMVLESAALACAMEVKVIVRLDLALPSSFFLAGGGGFDLEVGGGRGVVAACEDSVRGGMRWGVLCRL
jgi:hypothetical protein